MQHKVFLVQKLLTQKKIINTDQITHDYLHEGRDSLTLKNVTEEQNNTIVSLLGCVSIPLGNDVYRYVDFTYLHSNDKNHPYVYLASTALYFPNKAKIYQNSLHHFATNVLHEEGLVSLKNKIIDYLAEHIFDGKYDVPDGIYIEHDGQVNKNTLELMFPMGNQEGLEEEKDSIKRFYLIKGLIMIELESVRMISDNEEQTASDYMGNYSYG